MIAGKKKYEDCSAELFLKLCGPTAHALNLTSADYSNGNHQQAKRFGHAITKPARLVEVFLEAHASLNPLKHDQATVLLDGRHLRIGEVTAVARHFLGVELTDMASTREEVDKSRSVVDRKVAEGQSIYGINTGFGGSSDTRTRNVDALGTAAMQHHHVGVLPTALSVAVGASTAEESRRGQSITLPLLESLTTLAMPAAWVRAAILVRANSFIRGHSAVRWCLIEHMAELLAKRITPIVPTRSSISASGDLSPLSYIAGTLSGHPRLQTYIHSGTESDLKITSARDALASAGIAPISYHPKEHLAILNGTAFSAGVAALALDEAVHLTLLSMTCTAMATESLLGTVESFHPFVSEVCRPHPGQIETAQVISSLLSRSKLARSMPQEFVSVEDDNGQLRQDRYSIRTAPQFIGPQVEDVLSAWDSVTIECNSSTDNPLIDGQTERIFHAGNFQAMSVSNAMEKTRLSLHHLGKILFAQATELLNPLHNNGLPPSLAATDPSTNFGFKGLDISIASYVSELGWLANPVTTHIQSAEMHNQSINSLALISARATMQSLDVLSMLMASFLCILCQAVDLRAMQAKFDGGIERIILEEFDLLLCPEANRMAIGRALVQAFKASIGNTSTSDAVARMAIASKMSTAIFMDAMLADSELKDTLDLSSIRKYQDDVATRAAELLTSLRSAYLSGSRGAATASGLMGKTRKVYEFIRVTLGVKFHGVENQSGFEDGLGVLEETIGESVSKIYEAIRDGAMRAVTVEMLLEAGLD